MPFEFCNTIEQDNPVPISIFKNTFFRLYENGFLEKADQHSISTKYLDGTYYLPIS
jgi:hypothetical protein